MAGCYEGNGSVGYWKMREGVDSGQMSLPCQKKVNQYLCLLVSFAIMEKELIPYHNILFR